MGISPSYFGRESLEECHGALIFHQVAHNRHSAHLVFEIRVLDARFDRVERGCNRDRRNSPRYGGDKVLCPCRLAIV
jgi:hypothetical protein